MMTMQLVLMIASSILYLLLILTVVTVLFIVINGVDSKFLNILVNVILEVITPAMLSLSLLMLLLVWTCTLVVVKLV